MNSTRTPDILARVPLGHGRELRVREYAATDAARLEDLAGVHGGPALCHTESGRRRPELLPPEAVALVVAELPEGPLAGAAWLEDETDGEAAVGLLVDPRFRPGVLPARLLQVITYLGRRRGDHRFHTCLDRVAYDFFADFREANVRVESAQPLGGVTHVTLVAD